MAAIGSRPLFLSIRKIFCCTLAPKRKASSIVFIRARLTLGSRTGHSRDCVGRERDSRALPDYVESGSALVRYIWSHFLRKTGVHFSGKCSKGSVNHKGPHFTPNKLYLDELRRFPPHG